MELWLLLQRTARDRHRCNQKSDSTDLLESRKKEIEFNVAERNLSEILYAWFEFIEWSQNVMIKIAPSKQNARLANEESFK